MTINRRKPDSQNQLTGSPRTGEPVYLAVGKIRRSHGIHGEMLMDILTDFPERLRPHRTVYIGNEYIPLHIHFRRSQDKALLLTFEEISTPEEATWLRNQLVYILVKETPDLPNGKYYHFQLLGMTVVDENGYPLGILTEIIETGANDVYLLIDETGNEILFPAIEQVVLDVDIQNRVMRVRPQMWE